MARLLTDLPIGCAHGFNGFVSIGDVRLQRATVSGLPGVYVIYRETPDPVEFLDKSTGGWFKGGNPSVPIETLEAAWVHDAHVLYVGKADAGQSGRRGIRARFDEYLRFGMGQPTGHWGGRYVWQLAGTDELMICFKPCTDPRDEERDCSDCSEGNMGRCPSQSTCLI